MAIEISPKQTLMAVLIKPPTLTSSKTHHTTMDVFILWPSSGHLTDGILLWAQNTINMQRSIRVYMVKIEKKI